MPIHDTLTGKTHEERCKLKSEEMAKVTRKRFDKDDHRIEIQGIEEIPGGVQVFAKAWRNGKKLGFGKDGSVEIERFRIFNPPILVSDPTGDIIRETTNPAGFTLEVRLKEDLEKALEDVLLKAVLQTGMNTTPQKGKVGNTVTLIYPSAGDGVVGFGTSFGQNDWGTARALATGQTATLADHFIQTVLNGGLYGLWRSFLPFDTSSLSGQVVSAATITLTRNADSGGGGTRSWALVAPTSQASTATLSTADFDQCAALDSPTECATRKPLTDWASDGSASAFTLNAAGIAAINTAGFSMFGVRCGTKDIDNSAPGDNRWQQYYASSASGTSNDPVLTVTHEAAPVVATHIPSPGPAFSGGGGFAF